MNKNKLFKTRDLFLNIFTSATLILTLKVASKSHALTEYHFTICPLKLLTGLSCPLCGTTRSFIAISKFNFAEAMYLNPIGILIYLFLISLPFTFKWFQLNSESRFTNIIFRGLETKKIYVSTLVCIVVYGVLKNTLITI